MKKLKYWIILGLVWVIVFVAYLIWWPPRPGGKIYALNPLEDRTALIVQHRWQNANQKKLILYRMNEEQDILWQTELPRANSKIMSGPKLLWADDNQVFINLILPPKAGASVSYKYQVLAYDLETGDEQWRSEELVLAPDEDIWQVESNFEPLFITGSESAVFTFHQYQNIVTKGRSPRFGNERKITVIAWDKTTGAKKWERGDIRPAGLKNPGTPMGDDPAKWARYRARDSVFNSYPSNFVSAVPLPEHDLLYLKGNHETNLFLDMESGITIGKMRSPFGGEVSREKFYYIVSKTGKDNYYYGKAFLSFDLSSLQFEEVDWLGNWMAAHPENRELTSIMGAGSYDNQDLFYLSFYSSKVDGRYIELLAVDRETENVAWSLPLVDKSGKGNYPYVNVDLDQYFPKTGPLKGEFSDYVPFYASEISTSFYFSSGDQQTFCVTDLANKSFEVKTFFTEKEYPLMFTRAEGTFILSGSTFALYNPSTGELEAAIEHNLFETAELNPDGVQSGLVWVTLYNKVLVMDGATLSIISGSDVEPKDVTNSTKIRLGLD